MSCPNPANHMTQQLADGSITDAADWEETTDIQRCKCGAFLGSGPCKRCEFLQQFFTSTGASESEASSLVETIAEAPPDKRPQVMDKLLAGNPAVRGVAQFMLTQYEAQGTANGHSANGHSANGHSANGHSTNGHSTNGHSPTSPAPESAEAAPAVDVEAVYLAARSQLTQAHGPVLDENDEVIPGTTAAVLESPAYTAFADAKTAYYAASGLDDPDLAAGEMRNGRYVVPQKLRNAIGRSGLPAARQAELRKRVAAVGRESAQRQKTRLETTVARILEEEGVDSPDAAEKVTSILNGRYRTPATEPKKKTKSIRKRRPISEATRQKLREAARQRTRCDKCGAFMGETECKRCLALQNALVEAGLDAERAAAIADRIKDATRLIEAQYRKRNRDLMRREAREYLAEVGRGDLALPVMEAIEEQFAGDSPLPPVHKVGRDAWLNSLHHAIAPDDEGDGYLYAMEHPDLMTRPGEDFTVIDWPAASEAQALAWQHDLERGVAYITGDLDEAARQDDPVWQNVDFDTERTDGRFQRMTEAVNEINDGSAAGATYLQQYLDQQELALSLLASGIAGEDVQPPFASREEQMNTAAAWLWDSNTVLGLSNPSLDLRQTVANMEDREDDPGVRNCEECGKFVAGDMPCGHCNHQPVQEVPVKDHPDVKGIAQSLATNPALIAQGLQVHPDDRDAATRDGVVKGIKEAIENAPPAVDTAPYQALFDNEELTDDGKAVVDDVVTAVTGQIEQVERDIYGEDGPIDPRQTRAEDYQPHDTEAWVESLLGNRDLLDELYDGETQSAHFRLENNNGDAITIERNGNTASVTVWSRGPYPPGSFLQDGMESVQAEYTYELPSWTPQSAHYATGEFDSDGLPQMEYQPLDADNANSAKIFALTDPIQNWQDSGVAQVLARPDVDTPYTVRWVGPAPGDDQVDVTRAAEPPHDPRDWRTPGKRRKPMETRIETLLEKHGLLDAMYAAEAGQFHARFENAGWQPLTVEKIGNNEVAITHWTTGPDGEPMIDTEITYRLPDWSPTSLTQLPVIINGRQVGGGYQPVYTADGKHIYRYAARGAKDIGRMWAANLRDQGWLEDDVTVTAQVEHDGADTQLARCLRCGKFANYEQGCQHCSMTAENFLEAESLRATILERGITEDATETLARALVGYVAGDNWGDKPGKHLAQLMRDLGIDGNHTQPIMKALYNYQQAVGGRTKPIVDSEPPQPIPGTPVATQTKHTVEYVGTYSWIRFPDGAPSEDIRQALKDKYGARWRKGKKAWMIKRIIPETEIAQTIADAEPDTGPMIEGAPYPDDHRATLKPVPGRSGVLTRTGEPIERVGHHFVHNGALYQLKGMQLGGLAGDYGQVRVLNKETGEEGLWEGGFQDFEAQTGHALPSISATTKDGERVGYNDTFREGRGRYQVMEIYHSESGVKVKARDLSSPTGTRRVFLPGQFEAANITDIEPVGSTSDTTADTPETAVSGLGQQVCGRCRSFVSADQPCKRCENTIDNLVLSGLSLDVATQVADEIASATLEDGEFDRAAAVHTAIRVVSDARGGGIIDRKAIAQIAGDYMDAEDTAAFRRALRGIGVESGYEIDLVMRSLEQEAAQIAETGSLSNTRTSTVLRRLGPGVSSWQESEGFEQAAVALAQAHQQGTIPRCERCQSFVSSSEPCKRCERLHSEVSALLPPTNADLVDPLLDKLASKRDDVAANNHHHAQRYSEEAIKEIVDQRVNNLDDKDRESLINAGEDWLSPPHVTQTRNQLIRMGFARSVIGLMLMMADSDGVGVFTDWDNLGLARYVREHGPYLSSQDEARVANILEDYLIAEHPGMASLPSDTPREPMASNDALAFLGYTQAEQEQMEAAAARMARDEPVDTEAERKRRMDTLVRNLEAQGVLPSPDEAVGSDTIREQLEAMMAAAEAEQTDEALPDWLRKDGAADTAASEPDTAVSEADTTPDEPIVWRPLSEAGTAPSGGQEAAAAALPLETVAEPTGKMRCGKCYSFVSPNDQTCKRCQRMADDIASLVDSGTASRIVQFMHDNAGSPPDLDKFAQLSKETGLWDDHDLHNRVTITLSAYLGEAKENKEDYDESTSQHEPPDPIGPDNREALARTPSHDGGRTGSRGQAGTDDPLRDGDDEGHGVHPGIDDGMQHSGSVVGSDGGLRDSTQRGGRAGTGQPAADVGHEPAGQPVVGGGGVDPTPLFATPPPTPIVIEVSTGQMRCGRCMSFVSPTDQNCARCQRLITDYAQIVEDNADAVALANNLFRNFQTENQLNGVRYDNNYGNVGNHKAEIARVTGRYPGFESDRQKLTELSHWFIDEASKRAEAAGDVVPADPAATTPTPTVAEPPPTPAAAEPVPAPSPAPSPTNENNYRITDEDQIGAGGPKAKYKANVDAIRLLKKLEAEGRQATPEEQAVLVKYVGWGSLSKVFDHENTYNWSNSPWKAEYQELKELLTDEEWEQARSTTLNAHYTSPEVIQGIWAAMQEMGYDNGPVLEPSVGVGHFIGMMPEEVAQNTHVVGTEIDSLTAGIAKHLYPDSDIRHSPYEDANLPNDYFNAVVGNVPFGSYGVYDPTFTGPKKRLTGRIHNYFMAKAVDQTAPGGMVALVTSRHTMDSTKNQFVREYLASQADLVGAIRLPNTAFKGNAGTEVTTDIIFLRKRAPNDPPGDTAWIESRAMTVPGEYGETEINVNEYYQNNPDMMLGRMEAKGSMYRDGEPTLVPHEGQDLGQALRETASRLPKDIAPAKNRMRCHCGAFMDGNACNNPRCSSKRDVYRTVELDFTPRDMEYIMQDGRLHQWDGPAQALVDLEATAKRTKAGHLPMALRRAKAVMPVKDATQKLLQANIEGVSDEELAAAQQELEAAYDAFVAEFGFIHDTGNMRAFGDDPNMPYLLALESYNKETKIAKKTDFFTKRMNRLTERPESADSAKDALMISLNEGGINWQRMASLTGQPISVLQEELKGMVFETPEGTWETADAYLSGDVKTKLRDAQAAAKLRPRFEENVNALLAVQPTDLKPSEIHVGFGAGWVPPEVMEDFTHHIFQQRIGMTYIPETGSWVMNKSDKRRAVWGHQNTTAWGTPGADALTLIEDALNNKQTTVNKKVPHPEKYGETKTVMDEANTLLARQKQAEIIAEFKEWIWADTERARQLSDLYNEKFNRIVPRNYDGSHLTFPGMNPAYNLRDYQKDAVWRVMQGDNTLLAHMVGAGKTFTMIAASMEMKRLGMRHKQMHVLPKNVVSQYAEEWQRLYPGAKLLVVGEGDMTPAKRQRTLSRMMTEDWDGILVTHSSYGSIPASDDIYASYLRMELENLDRAIEAENAADNGYGYRGGQKSETVKQIENAKKRLETQLKNLMDKKSKDDGLRFDELGIDAIFVDEAHNYKNLYTATKMTRVAGVKANTGSKRATDMYLKTQYLSNRCKCGRFVSSSGICKRCQHKTEVVKGSVIFATGTPVANSVGELFNMQRYLQPEELEKQGLSHFDAWANMYGEMVSAIEMKPSGDGYRSFTRFAKFKNVPELLRTFGQTADFQMDPIAMGLKRPLMTGGGDREEYEQSRLAFLDFAGEGALTENDLLAPGFEELEESPEYVAWTKARNAYRRPIPVALAPSQFQEEYVAECGRRADNIANVDPKEDNMLKIVGDARKVALDQRMINPNLPDDPGSKVNAAVASMLDIYQQYPDTTQMMFLDDMGTPGSGKAKIGTLSYWRRPDALARRLSGKLGFDAAEGMEVGTQATQYALAGPDTESVAGDREAAEQFVERFGDIVGTDDIDGLGSLIDSDGRKAYLIRLKPGHKRCESCKSFISPGKPCQRCARFEQSLDGLPPAFVNAVKANLDNAVANDDAITTSDFSLMRQPGMVRNMVSGQNMAKLEAAWREHAGADLDEATRARLQQVAEGSMIEYYGSSMLDRTDMESERARGDVTTRDLANSTAEAMTQWIEANGLSDSMAAMGRSDYEHGNFTELGITDDSNLEENLRTIKQANTFLRQLTGINDASVSQIMDKVDGRQLLLAVPDDSDISIGDLHKTLVDEIAAADLDAYVSVANRRGQLVMTVREPVTIQQEAVGLTMPGGDNPEERAEAIRKALKEIGLPVYDLGQQVQEVQVTDDGQIVVNLHQVKIPTGMNIDLYDDMKVKLIDAGVPEDEIAFIHDANTDAQKLELFRKMNEGGLSFLFGSTEKMGTGTNAQKRLKAMHHLNAPWRPDQLEQREGRILRYGNDNEEVIINRYLTEASFDVYMWQTLERKAGFIQQITRGDLNAREMEDVGDAAADFATMRAVATGNPAVLELVQAETDLKKLEAMERAHFDRTRNLQWRVRSLPAEMQALREEIARHDAAIAAIQKPEQFEMTVDGNKMDKQLDAGNALADMIAKKDAEVKGKDFSLGNVGELYGMPLRVERSDGKTYAMLKAGPMELSISLDNQAGGGMLTGQGMITRLRNQIDKLPQKREEKLALLADKEDRLPKIKAILNKPFEQAEELATLRARVGELQEMLQSDGKSADDTVLQMASNETDWEDDDDDDEDW